MRSLLMLLVMSSALPAQGARPAPRKISFSPIGPAPVIVVEETNGGSGTVNPQTCNEDAKGYWDAPASFWQDFWNACPPVQMGSLDGQPVYAERPGLRASLIGSPQKLIEELRKAIRPAKGSLVELSLLIDSSGSIRDVRRLRAAGTSTQLDANLSQTIRNEWRFSPAHWRERSVAVRQKASFQF